METHLFTFTEEMQSHFILIFYHKYNFFAYIKSCKSDNQSMKRLTIALTAGLLFASSLAFAEKVPVQEKDLYEYNNIITKLDKAEEPQVYDNYIVFTEESGPRFVGIVFDFENYQTIHPFQIHKNYDLEGNVRTSVMFYLLERPKDLTEITYRLIIDGLWTSDPINPDKVYDETAGISLSRVDLGTTLPEITYAKAGGTKFIYNGEPGQTVRLSGTFTNWDSWIYELEETAPGFYELNLPLPQGKYYYNYYLGMNAIVDKTNPNRAYTEDGRTASVIVVQ